MSILDCRWLQRLRDVYQTGCCRYVFPFSENTRFGHSLHAAYLMYRCAKKLEILEQSVDLAYSLVLASLLHDIGHLAPGSHLAWRIWFPDQQDFHEKLGLKIITSSWFQSEINLPDKILDYLIDLLGQERRLAPEYCYQLLHGDFWNVDRGSWIYTDSILSGVGFGIYNVDALIDSLIVKQEKLGIKKRRIPTLLSFFLSRFAMYDQVFYHPKVLSAEVLLEKIVKRAKFLSHNQVFADETMVRFLRCASWNDVGIEDVYVNSESWFRYHLIQWSKSKDSILSDLCMRFMQRRFFKYFEVSDHNIKETFENFKFKCTSKNLDPDYYLSMRSVNLDDLHKNGEVFDEDLAMQCQNILMGMNKFGKKNYIFGPLEIFE